MRGSRILKHNDLWKTLDLFSIIILWCVTFVIFTALIYSFSQGIWIIELNFNEFNEGFVELILMFIGLFFGLIGITYRLKELSGLND